MALKWVAWPQRPRGFSISVVFIPNQLILIFPMICVYTYFFTTAFFFFFIIFHQKGNTSKGSDKILYTNNRRIMQTIAEEKTTHERLQVFFFFFFLWTNERSMQTLVIKLLGAFFFKSFKSKQFVFTLKLKYSNENNYFSSAIFFLEIDQINE